MTSADCCFLMPTATECCVVLKLTRVDGDITLESSVTLYERPCIQSRSEVVFVLQKPVIHYQLTALEKCGSKTLTDVYIICTYTSSA